jgi:hypothetical protein
MGLEDAGWNVLKLAKRYGIEDRLILTKNDGGLPGIDSQHLNILLSASPGGGFWSFGVGNWVRRVPSNSVKRVTFIALSGDAEQSEYFGLHG